MHFDMSRKLLSKLNNMNKNKMIIGLVIVVVLIIASFYSGMKYGGNNVVAAQLARGTNFGGNRSTGGANGMMRGGQQNGSGVAGNIISKDATSITVGLRAGGSKIVFFSPSTAISTMASGTPSDLISGKQVIVSGTTNQDGSISATMIQVR
jgi:hypothetical protein